MANYGQGRFVSKEQNSSLNNMHLTLWSSYLTYRENYVDKKNIGYLVVMLSTTLKLWR